MVKFPIVTGLYVLCMGTTALSFSLGGSIDLGADVFSPALDYNGNKCGQCLDEEDQQVHTHTHYLDFCIIFNLQK